MDGQRGRLRVLLGVGDWLKDWRDFCRRAIEPALGEVNEFAAFTAEWAVHRQLRRRVVAVRFTVTKKTGESEGRPSRRLMSIEPQRNPADVGGIRGLKTYFATDDGWVRAVDGVDIVGRHRRGLLCGESCIP